MSKKLQEVLDTLHRRFGFEIVTPTITANRVRVLGRMKATQEPNWVIGIQHILAVAASKPWSVDFSRHYFLREGSVVYAWRVILQATNLESHADDIISTMLNAPRAHFEVEEQMLSVRGVRSTMNSKGKGASAAGTVPRILQNKAGGG